MVVMYISCTILHSTLCVTIFSLHSNTFVVSNGSTVLYLWTMSDGRRWVESRICSFMGKHINPFEPQFVHLGRGIKCTYSTNTVSSIGKTLPVTYYPVWAECFYVSLFWKFLWLFDGRFPDSCYEYRWKLLFVLYHFRDLLLKDSLLWCTPRHTMQWLFHSK